MHTNIRKGLHIQHNKEIYKVIDFLHVKPGKGYAFVRTKLKNMITGHILENNFSAKHRVKEAKIVSDLYQYMYRDGEIFYFMNTTNYNQIQIDKKLIKNHADFLKEGIRLTIFFHVRSDNNQIALFLKMPPTVILKVKYTEKVRKIDTINTSSKISILETGAKLLVPLFINTGEYIKINTDRKSYIERIRK
ncbi:elongation factor P [Blattabacterium cuenoti]|uniref:elongation factor P n=1 Tax=Blattabacterium cuenoti TaxID=1653831 RepID=UPI00163C541B|nr:elongation factor P [Blattabacterium cuenoti]